MKNYDLVFSSATQQKLRQYLEETIKRKKQPQALNNRPGARLKTFLHDSKQIPELSDIDLLRCLLRTKSPQIFAESAVIGDGSDWNFQELSILGDIGVSVNVSAFDNGLHANPHIHQVPIDATLLFIPGALLRSNYGIPADWEEVVKQGVIDQDAFNTLYQRRLLPLFMHANKRCEAQGSQALITIPGLGCGQFSGPFHGQLGIKLKIAIATILEKHGGTLSNIKAIYYDPYSECVNERNEINGTSLLVRPLRQDNYPKAQLCHPVDYQEQDDDFSHCDLFSVVAWDHVSWPGNDFFIGSRTTDDGVKAAATNVMQHITGVEGNYDTQSFRYNPPRNFTDWEKVVDENHVEFGQQADIYIY